MLACGNCNIRRGKVDTKWLEDFISLAETRSFSRSATLRHVTQPAFSRRIQALEAWAGIDLVDRSSYPTRLTPAGETFHAQALEMTELLRSRTRAEPQRHVVHRGSAGAESLQRPAPITVAGDGRRRGGPARPRH